MFNRKNVFVLALLAVAIGIVAFGDTATFSVWVTAPSPLVQSKDAMNGFDVDSQVFSSTSFTNTATTTAQVVSTLAGRKQIIFQLAAGDTGAVWVNVGTVSPSLNKGIQVTNSTSSAPTSMNPLILNLDANVPVSYISSTAAVISVTQLAVKRRFTNPIR